MTRIRTSSHSHSARPAAAHASGYTLVEILIAMTVGLFLVGGLLMIEQNVHYAQQNQNGLAQLQDEERIAMSLLNDVIQSAGYYPDPTTNGPAINFPQFTPASTTVTLALGQMLGGETPGSDTIVVRYMTSGADNLINCVGGTAAVPTVFTNVFTVANGQLLCSDGANLPVPIVNGVVGLQALYGVASGGGTSTNVDTYMTATQVTNAGLWPSVTSVRVTVTFTNPLAGQPGYTTAASQTVSFSRVITLQSRTGVNTA